jgi:hypothetical protein
MKRQPTTQQITWFLDLYRNSQLDLEPPYQRKSVWSSKDRKFFLDTIFRNYPAPPIFIHRTVNDQGYTKYHVVDGKQRLETILSFFESRISIAQDFGDANLNGKKFKDLTQEYKRQFWDYTLVVDFIDSIDGNNIEEVFDRVNRNARNLLPQELRHARYNGWFINFVEEESDIDFWWNYKISTRGRDKRMKNVQFVSELLIIILENNIVGFDQDFIDEIYAKYDDIEEFQESGEFNIEEFKDKLNHIKEFILAVDSHNDSITKFAAGSNNNFYTLWAYILINNPQDHTVFAEAYEVFMQKVSRVKEMQTAGENIEENVLLYSNSSKGAVTDLPQRKERLLALANSL